MLSHTTIILWVVLWYGFLNYLKSAIQYVIDIIIFPITNDTIRDLSCVITHRIHHAQCAIYTSDSEIISILKRVSPSIRLLIKSIIIHLIPTIVKCFIAIVVLSRLCFFSFWTLTILFLGFSVTLSMMFFYIKQRRIAWQKTDIAIKIIGDYIKTRNWAFQYTNVTRDYLYEKLSDEADNWYKTNTTMNLMYLVQEMVIFLLTGYILIMGIQMIESHALKPSDFLLIQGHLATITIPIRAIIGDMKRLAESYIDLQKINILINCPQKEYLSHVMDMKSGVLASKISFAYQGQQNLLNNVDFEIKYGDHVLINGPSGSGKSTLSQIICGILQPTQGDIQIFGKNSYTPTKQMVYLPQNPHIFFESVGFNLNLGIDVSSDQLKEALGQVELDIDLDQPTQNLSEGQKQRVFLARIFLIRPLFLVMDEATNALEFDLERRIIKRIFEIVPTIVSVCHRLTGGYDQLWLLKNGKIEKKIKKNLDFFKRRMLTL